MSRYTTIRGRHKGEPYLEVLCDGQPFGDEYGFDANFRFGVVKAMMFVTYRELIEVFSATGGKRPKAGETFTLKRGSMDREVRCEVFAEFGRLGRRIKKPYLHFESFAAHIGIGVTKADAVTAVIRDIEQFLKEHG